ncbi:MAG: hypothetical protein K9K79_01150 [Desulfohalobiaceae bacterium]|nr:hypothetical protein [Desulfohalobiaceae bacterium]
MTRNKDVPVYNFTDGYDLNSTFDIGECLDNLIFFIEKGYFLTWEAVVRDEQNLPLSEKQEDALEDLLKFSDDESQILYIDEIPRPAEPWYETVRKIVPKLLIEPFKTFEIYDEIYHEGWVDIADCIEKYAYDLSLPEGLSSPIEVIQPDIRHKLWLQYSFDILSGLGQEDELTLENEEQRSWRIEDFIDSLREFRESVGFFNLTLNDLLKLVILPPKDEKILIDSLLHELGMKSSSDKLADRL